PRRAAPAAPAPRPAAPQPEHPYRRRSPPEERASKTASSSQTSEETSVRRTISRAVDSRRRASPAVLFKSRANSRFHPQEAAVPLADDPQSDWQLPPPLAEAFDAALRAWDIVR